MSIKKKVLIAGLVFILGTEVSAQSLNDCFTGYKNNDLELQELQVKVKQAENSLKRAKVDNGAEISISTGDMSIELNSDSPTIEVSPSATVSVPSLNGTSLTASVPVDVTVDSSGTTTVYDDADISLSTDIISNTSKLAALEIESAQRDLVLARRDVDVRHIALEEAFWNEVRDIYEAAQTLAAAKTTLYTKQSDFTEVKVEGYAPYSSTYISAQLEVNSADRAVKEDERLLKNALNNFALDCGLNNDVFTEPPRLPEGISSTQLIDIHNYNKQSYIDLEEAIWTNTYNEKSRKADTDFSLSADVGYGWDNYTTPDDTTHSVSAGLSASYKGLSVSAGLSTPIEDPSDPSLLLSFGWDFSDMKTSSLDDKDDEYDRQLEILDIKTAEESYDDDVQNAETDYSDLIWSRKENSDNLALYKKLYENSVEWSKKGLIADSDFAQNKNSYEQAQYTASLTDIDYVLYNLQIAQYFIDSEVTDYTQPAAAADQKQTGDNK